MKLALIGDIHCAWGPEDVAYFDGHGAVAKPYDAVLFTGDLPGLRHGRILDVATKIGALQTPGFMVPGNHDGPSLGELVADIAGLSDTNLFLHRAMRWRLKRLQAALKGVQLCGFSHHTIRCQSDATAPPIGLIVVRPHSQGGHLNFRPYIRRAFGPATIDESSALLRRIVDECPYERLVFLGHNGPAGLGSDAADMFGADHKPNGGDWGDLDYREAVDYAQASGKKVLAVVAGHMHLRTKQRKIRPWCLRRDETLYINAAKVPRVFRAEDGVMRRYHTALTLDGDSAIAEQVTV